MLKLIALAIVLSVAYSNVHIYGDGTAAPYTTLNYHTTTTANKVYKLTFQHKAAADLAAGNGVVTVCCTTSVSNSAHNSLVNKCFVHQTWCSSGTCSASANSHMELKSATLSGTTVSVHSAIAGGTVAHSATGTYTDTFELTSAEATAIGHQDSYNANYKIHVTCHSDPKTSGMTAAQTVTTKPTAHARAFSRGSGALGSLLPAGFFASLVALYMMF